MSNRSVVEETKLAVIDVVKMKDRRRRKRSDSFVELTEMTFSERL